MTPTENGPYMRRRAESFVNNSVRGTERPNPKDFLRRFSLVLPRDCVFGFAHRFALEIEAIGVVDQAVEDGVSNRGVGDDFVPLLDWVLAGNESRTVTGTVVDDLEKVAVLSGADGRDPQIIDDEEAGFLNALEELGEAVVGLSLL